MNKKRTFSWIILVASIACHAQVNQQGTVPSDKLPGFAIKTNLLYDATSTINLGAEFKLGRKTTFDIPVSYNPWTFSDNKKWKHILVQPEYRWWTRQAFKGHFFGLHAHYAFYNVGGLENPPFSEYMNAHRFEGWLAGAGVSYGYRRNFSHNWGIEASIGVGYAYLSYDLYPCTNCGEKIGSKNRNYLGPTKAAISLIYSIGKKKEVPVLVPVVEPVAPLPVVAPPVVHEPVFAASFIVPEAETVKVRQELGKAYLDYATGRSEILPGFRNNTAELERIYALINEIKNTPNATITGITVIGYASPEGSFNSNLTLSEKRAQVLAEHLKKLYHFPNDLFKTVGKGEDWQMLEELVSRSDMKEKERILSIIRQTDIFAGREKRLMELNGGTTYREMLKEMFPKLRRSDYELSYTVLPFTIEEGKEVFRVKPSSLSMNEMFLIAQTYEKGSDNFNELFETAARLFPASDVSNLNAAASALSRKEVQRAEAYLDKVKTRDAVYLNNAGILAYLKGDKEKALECFAKASTMGSNEAAGNSKEIQSYLSQVIHRKKS